MKFFFIHLLLIYSCGQSFCQQSQYLAALSTNTESHLHDTVLAKKYIELCDNCLLENRFDSALIYADKAMILSRESGYRKGIVSVLNSYGVIKYRLSEYDKALDYFMQALKIAEEMKLEKSAALISSNIGEVNVVTGNNPELGLEQMQLCEVTIRKLNAQTDLVAIYIRLGECYEMTGKEEKKTECIKKALEIGEVLIRDTSISGLNKKKIDLYYRIALYRKGRMLIANGKYADARALYYQLLSSIKESAGQKERLLYESQLTEMYLKMEYFDSALAHANKMFGALKKDSIPDLYRYACALRSAAYEGLGKPQMALEDYKRFKDINDNIFNSSMISRISSLQKENEVKEKEVQIMYSNKAKQFYQFLFFISLVAAAGAFAFFFINKRANRLQQQVHAQNEQMMIDRAGMEKNNLKLRIAELEQKALRAQMNPHFIFNSLNSIQYYVINNDIDGANKYISLLGDLIRRTLYYSSKAEIKLSEEICYVSSYLELEKMRLQDAFTFNISVEPGIDADIHFIPPLLLQPFVENAIRHGIKYLDTSDGKIEVAVYRKGNGLMYTITDNGVGRELTSKFKKNYHHEYQSKGIELSRNRIVFMSNDKVKPYIQIYDLKNKEGRAAGTQVVIFIPGCSDE